MKLIIAGSRGITDYEIIRQAVVKSGIWKTHGNKLEIVSGGARGVDILGEIFAIRNGLVCHRFPVTKEEWSRIGKSAGFRRNERMGDFADGLLAIWDGQSNGTRHMISYAKTRGLEVYVHIV